MLRLNQEKAGLLLTRVKAPTRIADPKNAVYNAYMAKRARALRARLQSVKNKPCQDCNQRFPHYVMDFDHVRGLKKYNVASLASSTKSWETVQAEIDKCDLVCSNCHRIRTWARGKQKNSPIDTSIPAGRIKQVPKCHPEKKHVGRGLCCTCYKRWKRGPKFCARCPNPLPKNKAKFCGPVCVHEDAMERQRMSRWKKKTG